MVQILEVLVTASTNFPEKERCWESLSRTVGFTVGFRTAAAANQDKKMGIATLQELMGHKKKETTLKYIHLARTNLRQEMSQTAL